VPPPTSGSVFWHRGRSWPSSPRAKHRHALETRWCAGHWVRRPTGSTAGGPAGARKRCADRAILGTQPLLVEIALADGPHADLPHCGQNPIVDADHQTERPARLVEKNADGRGIQTHQGGQGDLERERLEFQRGSLAVMTFTPTTSLSLHAHRAPLGAGPVDACARSCRRCGSGTSGSWTQWPVVSQNQITREFTVLSPAETEAEKPAPPRPTYDWAAANPEEEGRHRPTRLSLDHDGRHRRQYQ